MGYRTLKQLFDDESAHPALAGSKSAVFLTSSERILSRKPIESEGGAGSSFFVGRNPEIRRLSDAFEEQVPLILMRGPSGVGKSALLSQFVQRQHGVPCVFVDYLRDAWPVVASGLHDIYGKIPGTMAERARGVYGLTTNYDDLLVASPFHPQRALIVFDNFDRRDGDVRDASAVIADILKRLAPAIGSFVTVVVASRAEIPVKHLGVVKNHMSFALEPFSKSGRIDFLSKVSREANIAINYETCSAIADASFGLPLILKSFFVRAEEQSRLRAGTDETVVGSSHFGDAIAASFNDVVTGFDSHLMALKRFQNVDFHLMQTVASFNTLAPVPVDQIFLRAEKTYLCTRRELRVAIRRLKRADMISSATASIVVKRPLVLPYLRALSWLEAESPKPGTSRSLFLQLIGTVGASKMGARIKHKRR